MDNKVKISAMICTIKGKRVGIIAINYDKESTHADIFYANADNVFDENYVAKQSHSNDELSNYVDDNTEINVIMEYMEDVILLINEREVSASIECKISEVQATCGLKISWL